MQINIKDIWTKEVREKHQLYLDSLLAAYAPAPGSMLDRLLQKHKGHFGLGKPKRLRAIIATVETLRKTVTDPVYEAFLKECKDLFDYGKFSNKQTKGWNAYGLCAESKYQVCPYCQQSAALTVYRDEDGKSFRPTLDHFYPKGEYPFLALSLYNLVPSCYTCNSSLKGKIDFYTHQHLHPFEDQELVRYEWDVKQYLEKRLNLGPMPGSLALTEVKLRGVPISHPGHLAAERSVKTFLLQERLELNLSSLTRYQDTLLMYSGGRLDEVNEKVFAKVGWTLTEGQALQFSYHDYKNEFFGRLKADLYDAALFRK
jgi:hypothetical protein